jgi:hypothetical protein
MTLRSVGNVACMEVQRNAHKILLRKHEETIVLKV